MMENNSQIVENSEQIYNQTIIQTDSDARNGQIKCPKCGATDISTNMKTGLLRCNFCRYEFSSGKITGMVEDLENLSGQVIASGATDINRNSNDVVTLKCDSCGAEVVIDTASSNQARCHWCRNTLSISKQIPNGAIPDAVLPFSIDKDTAKKEISKYVTKHKFYANPKFKKEFNINNIMGVYFPYMLVDINAHANLIGEGEHQVRKYTRGSDENETTYYDANLYHVEREFDIVIDGLSIESNLDRLNSVAKDKTNNIINAIMPFDIENCIKYNANYLKGYTSERRDANIKNLKKIVDLQAKDIARFAANDTLKTYDRGVKWTTEDFNIKGEQWMAAYLPVWLYSYQQVKGNKKILHYVAVNARTKETIGSIPLHMPKLVGVSFILEIIGIALFIFLADFDYNFIFLLIGILYFVLIFATYRNSSARHTYELETKRQVSNLRKVDEFVTNRVGLKNPYMIGFNNTKVEGKMVPNTLTENMMTKGIEKGIIDTFLKK